MAFSTQPAITGFELLSPSGDGSTWVDHFISLNIVSVAEAAAMWGKHPHTVRAAFRNQKVTGVIIGKDIVLTIPSLIRHFGEPVVKISITYPAGVVIPNVN